MNTQSNFIIIGAGPKALAVVAKAYVLKKLFKVDIPHFHIIEKKEIAANWTGKNGFTNGRLRLGTSPQKDVGFPYQSQIFGDDRDKLINEEMRKFSWDNYLINIGQYSDWIDRGRPNPTHNQWANYLKYGFSLASEIITIHQGELEEISEKKDIFFVTYSGGECGLRADFLMLTGPGESKTKIPPMSSRIFDINSYWKSNMNITGDKRILIIGGGENSATIALDINQRIMGRDVQIDILTPSGGLISRGESYFENRTYTDAKLGHWSKLSKEDKKSFIKHTDLGVYSVEAMNELSKTSKLNIMRGRAKKTVEIDEKVTVTLFDEERSLSYDKVIWANGFQKTGLLHSKLGKNLRAKFNETLGELTDNNLEGKITSDLSIKDISPKLFLPMISGMSQGPGFSNLSSLGSLADRVLSEVIQLEQKGIYEVSN